MAITNMLLLQCGESTLDVRTSKLESDVYRARILEQVTINRRLLIGRDGHLDQSEAYDLS